MYIATFPCLARLNKLDPRDFHPNSQNVLVKLHVLVLEALLETERAARAEANNRAEALSVQLQSTQGKLDSLQQQMTTVRLNESALDGKLKTVSHGKRVRVNDTFGTDSVQEMDIDDRAAGLNKRSRSTNSPLKIDTDDNNQSQEPEDYTKLKKPEL